MRKLCLSVAALLALGGAAHAEDWIATWGASPQPLWSPDFFAPVKVPRNLWNQTLREVASISLGGKKLRITVSNLYGSTPLTVSAAHIALAGDNGSIQTGSDHAVTFDGKPGVVVPAESEWISDPVDFAVEPLSKLSVSLYFAGVEPMTTTHWEGRDTAYISEGNTAADATIKPSSTITAKPMLSQILVDAPADAKAVVTFGDSITDGDGSKIDQTHRWPDFLARRLKGTPISVVNEGISGARVLVDRMGNNALSRFDHDVIAQPHVSTVILTMGINDIGWPNMLLDTVTKEPKAEDITNAYKQLIERAHWRGIRILGATLTPFQDTFKGGPLEGYYNEDKEQIRAAVNDWIRNSGAFDGVVDFDALARDPANPKHIKAENNSGDNLHPNDAAYEAMANWIDLGMLKGGK
jgi:lysophospholipase L1-like esterase